MKKNKRYKAMCDMDGRLYVADWWSRGWGAGRYPRFTDGALFLCLEDSPDFDSEAFQKTLNPTLTELSVLSATARAMQSYEQHREVAFLAPNGKCVRMMVRGNKTKFKKVTRRTKVK